MDQKIILASFSAFSILLIFFVIRILVRGINIFAKPPINPMAFLFAKMCAFSSCFFIPAGVLRPDLKWTEMPAPVGLFGLALLLAGIFFAVASMKKLDDDLVFGLPSEGIQSLKTNGIFRLSRNPLYVGFILIILSSWLITPNPINVAAGSAAIALHHLIVLREEKFLISELKDEYTDYMKRTGRYLLSL